MVAIISEGRTHADNVFEDSDEPMFLNLFLWVL